MPAKQKPQNYYEILGVDRSASNDEIRNAFRKLARETHQDMNPGSKKGDPTYERWISVSEAYSVLSKPEKRSEYNRTGNVTEKPNIFYTNNEGQTEIRPTILRDFFRDLFPNYGKVDPSRTDYFSGNVDWATGKPINRSKEKPGRSEKIG